MTLEIKLSPQLEQQLQQAAAQAGMSPDLYVIQLVEQGLTLADTPQRQSSGRFSATETKLLQRINHSLSPVDWNRYHTLLSKRDDATLTLTEHTELIAFSDQIEALNSDRIQALAELAKTWHQPIKTVMARLGLKPIFHG